MESEKGQGGREVPPAGKTLGGTSMRSEGVRREAVILYGVKGKIGMEAT